MRNAVVLLFVFVFPISVFAMASKIKKENDVLVFQSTCMKAFVDSGRGSLRKVCNLITGEDYLVSSDNITLELDSGVIDLSKISLRLADREKSSCRFVGQVNNVQIALTYIFGENKVYFDRQLVITNTSEAESFVVKKVTDCSLRFSRPFSSFLYHNDGMDRMDPGGEIFHEMTDPVIYHNAMNVFMRSSKGGLLAGLKYPYWKYQIDNTSLSVSYETNYRIKPQESLGLPVMFCGVYANTGYTCRKELNWKPRLLITEQEEMDWGEIRAMQQVVRDFIPEEPCPKGGYYLWLNSWWANRDLQGRIDEKTALSYCVQAERVRQSQCLDALLIAPVWVGWAGFIEPGPEIDAIGEDAEFPISSLIANVLSCAKSAGTPIYAFCEPSSLNRHYRKDKPEWAVRAKDDPNSPPLNQKCWANDAYADWFFRLTCSAIDKCNLIGWAWDHAWVRRPAMCYSKDHGHEPGNCEFHQYRNVTHYIQNMRNRYPSHLFEVYWGLKTAGTWAHQGLNTLENIYENNSPAPPGMTAADDLRFQHWYNHNYRFFPTYMNMGHINFENKEANGHLYSILSALNASSHGQLNDWVPFTTDQEADVRFALLRYWKAWATKHHRYLKDRIDLFGQPCRPDGIDGSAHIIEDSGFIFVFNPWPQEKYGSIPLDEMIGLTKGVRFSIDEISSQQNRRLGVYNLGQDFVFSISPKSAMLIEIKPTSEKELKLAAVKVENEIQSAFKP